MRSLISLVPSSAHIILRMTFDPPERNGGEFRPKRHVNDVKGREEVYGENLIERRLARHCDNFRHFCRL